MPTEKMFAKAGRTHNRAIRCASLVEYLNKERSGSQEGRVTSLVRRIRELKDPSRYPTINDEGFRCFDMTANFELLRSLQVDRASISLTWGQAIPSWVDGSSGSTGFIAVNGRNRAENLALEYVFQLEETGALHSVERCPTCEVWFTKSRSGQKRCSPECRHKNHRKSNHYREAMRVYVRSRRTQVREEKIDAIRAAKATFEGGAKRNRSATWQDFAEVTLRHRKSGPMALRRPVFVSREFIARNLKAILAENE